MRAKMASDTASTTEQHSLGMRIPFLSRSLIMGSLLFCFVCSAQDAVPTIEERLSDPVYMSWVADESVSQCISCHYDGPNLAQIAAGRRSQLTAFSRRQELEHWLAKDKHTIARRRVEPFSRDRNEQELIALMTSLDTRA